MTKLLKYIKGHALICAILAPLTMAVEVFMDLLQPTLMANIIDIGIANRDLSYVLKTSFNYGSGSVYGFTSANINGKYNRYWNCK